MTTLGVPVEALPAWDRLTRALLDYQPPCASEPERWWSYDDESVEAAVTGCRRCRVLQLCGAYADAAKETHGIWAGTDRELRHRGPIITKSEACIDRPSGAASLSNVAVSVTTAARCRP